MENTWIEFEVSLGYRVKGPGGVQDLEEEPGATRGTVKETEDRIWEPEFREQARIPESQ